MIFKGRGVSIILDKDDEVFTNGFCQILFGKNEHKYPFQNFHFHGVDFGKARFNRCIKSGELVLIDDKSHDEESTQKHFILQRYRFSDEILAKDGVLK